MRRRPSVAAFGDGAVLAELGDVAAAHRLGRLLQAELAGGADGWLEDVVVGFGTVTVIVDPWRAELDALTEHVRQLADADSRGLGPALPLDDASGAPHALEIPVRFDGPDLDEVADLAGLDAAGLVQLLAAADLEVAFVGFSPGFAYLVGLPSELASVPRRDRPRTVVPAGSVALGGGFAGIYPQATPGGWHIVGRTAVTLFDPTRPPFAVLSPGRRVRLVASTAEVSVPAPPGRLPLTAVPGAPAMAVERPGTCTLVQDVGRRGVAALGVPRAGAADQLSLRLANRLVGNDEDGAVLEVTGRGPELRATADLHVTVLGDPVAPGVEVRLDGRAAPEAEVLPVSRGQVLEVGSTTGAVRAVVAVSGGIDTELLLGSRSSDLLCGLGPGPLLQGDVLGIGRAGRPRGRLIFSDEAPSLRSLRVMPGPDVPGAPDGSELERLLGGDWLVSPAGNRVGVRLASSSSAAMHSSDGRPGIGHSGVGPRWGGTSRGMVTGAVQFPPGGEAIVLGPDHATVGGYPVLAVVVAADLHRLAHLPPGASVRFEVIGRPDADAARRRFRHSEEGAVQGWFPTRAG